MKHFTRVLLILLLLAVTAFAGDGKTAGLVFFDYSHDTADDAANGFGFHRVSYSYQRELSEGISYKFQTDIDTKSSPFNVYLKYAKVDWKSPMGKLTIGLQSMNVSNVQEKNWGYRSIEKSAMDHNKWSSSADMGIAYSKTLARAIYLNTMILDGAGYKHSEDDSHKKISVQAIYGETKVGKKDVFQLGAVQTYEPYDFEVDSVTIEKKNKLVTGVFGTYAGNGIRVGAEFNILNDSRLGKTEQLISAYANYRLTKGFEVFNRYDLLNPDTETSDNGESLFIAGAVYSPGKGLKIIPNLHYEMYADSAVHPHTSNLAFEIKL
ncbi:MAG: hypothetical protein U9Q77_06385 [Candidatus Marinimicrobia bacterium]|nr:hypothetical protein [Candidatus Neomarinimicrobiota bacterium]